MDQLSAGFTAQIFPGWNAGKNKDKIIRNWFPQDLWKYYLYGLLQSREEIITTLDLADSIVNQSVFLS